MSAKNLLVRSALNWRPFISTLLLDLCLLLAEHQSYLGIASVFENTYFTFYSDFNKHDFYVVLK